MPLGFDLDANIREALIVMRGDPIEVELLFDRKTAAWAAGTVAGWIAGPDWLRSQLFESDTFPKTKSLK